MDLFVTVQNGETNYLKEGEFDGRNIINNNGDSISNL
jgi:hypothetical protein